MADGSAPYWFPVLTLGIGAVGGYIAEVLRDRRTSSRQRVLAKQAFERDALIELQDWAGKLATQTSVAFSLHEMEYERSRQWAPSYLGSQADVEARTATTNMRRFESRVFDDAIVTKAGEFETLCYQSVVGPSEHEDDAAAKKRARHAMSEMRVAEGLLMLAIGARIRSLM